MMRIVKDPVALIVAREAGADFIVCNPISEARFIAEVMPGLAP
jgi:hypothetical protein